MATHLVFDFFGTLVDYSPSRTAQGYSASFALLREAGCRLSYTGFLALWSETFEALDARSDATHREFSMLEGTRLFLEAALDDPDPELAPRFVRVYLREWNRGVRYIEGVPELLKRLSRRFALSVITNTHDPDLVPDHLRAIGVDRLLGQVVTSVELGVRKPSSAIFHHALSGLGVAPEDCVYVGDSYPHDYRGARGAGLGAVLIDPARDAPVPDAARIDSILELEAALARL